MTNPCRHNTKEYFSSTGWSDIDLGDIQGLAGSPSDRSSGANHERGGIESLCIIALRNSKTVKRVRFGTDAEKL
jgi:hypothetical protein